MKYLLFALIILFISCDAQPHRHKWVLNSIHPGIVINAYSDGTRYSYCGIQVLDSGNVYEGHITDAIWREMEEGDTIVNFK